MRKAALSIAEAAYEAIDTRSSVVRKLKVEGNELVAGDIRLLLSGKALFIGVGKCAMAAGQAIEELLGDRLGGGVALDVSMPPKCDLKKIECYLGTHPMPSQANIEGTARILEVLSGLAPEDVVIALISGGGSTLLCQPQKMTCDDEGEVLAELFRRAAPIGEINTIRKHLSSARGGGIARAAYPAHVLGFVISDVPGNDISVIASGPTVKDATTVADAETVAKKYGLDEKLLGTLIETPKEEKYFENVQNMFLVTNKDALEAMRAEAERLGFKAAIADEQMTGEASAKGEEVAAALRAAAPKTALIYGGETTVTIGAEKGIGGRNQEFALAGLARLSEGELVASFASDGHDFTPAAGAIADAETARHATEKGLGVEDYLKRHDSFAFFQATGDALDTGTLESNVSDLVIALRR